MVERSRRNEVLLLYLRFFNILMSRKKIKHEESKVRREMEEWEKENEKENRLNVHLCPPAVVCLQYAVVCDGQDPSC